MFAAILIKKDNPAVSVPTVQQLSNKRTTKSWGFQGDAPGSLRFTGRFRNVTDKCCNPNDHHLMLLFLACREQTRHASLFMFAILFNAHSKYLRSSLALSPDDGVNEFKLRKRESRGATRRPAAPPHSKYHLISAPPISQVGF